MKKYNSIEEWLEKNDFNENGFTYTVIGEDTYSIKDTLRDLGFKWHSLLKWHKANTTIDESLPDGYKLLPLDYRDYLIWDEEFGNMIWKANAEEEINRKIDNAREPSLSEYLPEEVGTRIRHLPVTLKSKRGFSGQYGWTNIYTFVYGEDILTWFTTSDHDNLEVGNFYDLTGTIKKKEEYKGVKNTQLSRCIIK